MDHAPTPPGDRDRVIDAARALSVCLVVVFHAGLWHTTHDAHGWNAHTMDLGPLGWYGSWFVMVMPLFFVTGGFAHALVVDRMHERGTGLAHFYANRGRRLVGPTTVFVTIFALPSSIAAWSGHLTQADFLSHSLTKLLWFLVSYLVVVLLAPVMVRLHDRSPWLAPVVLMAVATAVDVRAITSGVLDVRYANLVFVWLACHQFGIAYHRGFLRRGPLWQPLLAVAVGVLAIVVLLHLRVGPDGRWPVPALGMGARWVSNLQPPTVAMAWLALAQTGVLALVARRRPALLERPGVQRAVQVLNALLMTIYLWHMPCVVLSFAIGIGVGMAVPTLAGISTFPLVTLAMALGLVALIVPRVARLDLAMIPPLGERQNGPLAVVALLVLTIALVGVWRHGLVLDPREPRSSLGVLGVWCGSAMLARAANRRR